MDNSLFINKKLNLQVAEEKMQREEKDTSCRPDRIDEGRSLPENMEPVYKVHRDCDEVDDQKEGYKCLADQEITLRYNVTIIVPNKEEKE